MFEASFHPDATYAEALIGALRAIVLLLWSGVLHRINNVETLKRFPVPNSTAMARKKD